MDYNKTISFLYNQLPMYQRTGIAAYKENLDNTLVLDEMFNHPHRRFKSVHVAGTNGKGSVSHMIASILQKAGYKVGLYTSPHLKDYRERIRVNGEQIQEEAVVDFVSRYRDLNAQEKVQPSFFELSVIMAFDYFAAQEVDIALIEVGLGGRLDSTNIISPEVSVITNISLDHTNLLGNTVEKIAGEKAGIIKNEVPVVIGETQDDCCFVFEQKAESMHAPLVFADQNIDFEKLNEEQFRVKSKEGELIITSDLKGEYQLKNIGASLAVIYEMRLKNWSISDEAIITGLATVCASTGLNGRWQILNEAPKVVCDTGHNFSGISWIVNQLKHEEYQQLHIVFGTVNDKNVDEILQLLPQEAKYYFTQATIDRALDVNQLYEKAVEYNLEGEKYRSVLDAFNAAKGAANPNDFIFVGGSTFVVAEVL